MSDTITITGNLAADPEQRMIGNGKTVTSFRVASGQGYIDKKSGNWVDKDPNWYQVSAFRDLGEHAFASLHKGERVIVSGRLKVRSWDNEKSKGTSVEIEADAVGHDLRWGTTRYARAQRRDQWEVPGADATDSGSAADRETTQWTTARPGEGAPADASTGDRDWGARSGDAGPAPAAPAEQPQTERELVESPF